MKEAVVIQNLTKKFDNFVALNDVQLTVNEGEVFALFRADGARETTLIKILTGLLKPSTGNVRVLGFKIPEEKDKLKKEIGYLSQNFSLYLDLTVEENITFFAEINKRKNFRRERDNY